MVMRSRMDQPTTPRLKTSIAITARPVADPHPHNRSCRQPTADWGVGFEATIDLADVPDDLIHPAH